MTNDNRNINLGWDRPLEVDWDFQLTELRREIRHKAPYKFGHLADAFNSEDTVVINDDHDVIDITVGKQHKAWPYAAIQEWGGPRHDVVIRPKRAKALRFWWNGKLTFAKKVIMKAGQILGSHYVERGVKSWWRKLTSGRLTVVKWRSKHYSRGLSTRGTLSE